MKRLLCAILILSMLIVPAACQRTDSPDGEKTVTEANTAAPGWSPDEGGQEEENGDIPEGENGGPAHVTEEEPVIEIPTVTEAKPDKEVKSISIKTEPKNTVYYAGSPIDTTGLTVNVKFKDGTEKAIAGGFGYSPTVASQGVKKVTVSYGGKTDTFSIKVIDDALKSISIKTRPDRLTYAPKEKIDTAGLEIYAQYESGTVRSVSSGYTVSPDSFSSAGTHNVTVSYGGKTTTFPVTVKSEKSGRSALISTIRVTKKPDRISYYLNEKLDTKGMIVTVNYADGTAEELTEGFKCTPMNLTEKGVQKIVVTYANKSTAFNVTVKEDMVKSIEIKKGPNKVNYYQNEVLDPEGLELTVEYESSPSKTITSGFTCTPTHLTEPGLQTITVAYAGKKRTFTVRVKEDQLLGLEIKTKPIKKTYYVGDTFNTDGLTLTATYASGRVQTVTEGYTFKPSEFGVAGDIPVMIYFGGISVQYTVKVLPTAVESMIIDRKPTKLKYAPGENIDTSGLVLKIKYTNGRTETVTSGYTYTPQKASVGDKTVKVTYNNMTVAFSITVEDAIWQITVLNAPSKTEYKVGETLDTTGMKVFATYESGRTEQLNSGYSCTPTKFTSPGKQKVTVVYNGLTASFYVNVTE